MFIGSFTHDHTATKAPGKHFAKDGSSEIVGSFTRAHYRTLSFATLADLEAWLRDAPSTTYLTSGIAPHQDAEAYESGMATRLLASGEGTCPETGRVIITRTNADLPHHQGPGLLVIDSDGIGDFNTIHAALIAAAPGLTSQAMLHTSSSSSRITGLTGDTGAHTALHVIDATDIPRAVTALHKRMVLTGNARHKLSKNGTFLDRSLVDVALAKPSQPIFIRAHLDEGIHQDKIFLLRPGAEMLDSRTAIPDLTEAETLAYEQAIAKAKLDMMPEIERVRGEYADQRIATLIATGVEPVEARASVMASFGGDLGPHHQITLSTGEIVTVGQILSAPEQYHGKACRDPIEPDYGSAGVAKIYASQSLPQIHSFAHGGALYRLRSDLANVDLQSTEQWIAEQTETARQAVDTTVALQWSLIEPVEETQTVFDYLDGKVIGNVIPGVGLVVDGRRIAAEPKQLCHWIEGHIAALPEWAQHLVKYAGTRSDTLEQHLNHAVKSFSGVGKRDGRPMLTAAVEAWEAELPVLVPMSGGEVAEPHDADLEEARQAAELLTACRHIADDPLGQLDAILTRRGVVGERRVANATFLTIATATTDKPINLINRGQSSAGKSFTTKAVIGLWPEGYVFTISSMSSKALIYLPHGSLANAFIFLEEGEALVRDNGEKNEIAEMLRVLLSEGHLIHMVTERDPDSGAHYTRVIEQPGPTGLITTTTRAHLDDEIETRMMSIWLDETEQHSRDIVANIAARAAMDDDEEINVEDWHAFGQWLRTGAHKVVVPFATEIAELLPTKAVRVRRDIRTLIDIIRASALIHRLHRDTTDRGRIIATLDDYQVAVDCIGQSISEGHEKAPSDNARALLQKIGDVMAAGIERAGGYVPTAGAVVPGANGYEIRDPSRLPRYMKVIIGEDMKKQTCLSGSIRDLADALGYSKDTFARHAANTVNAGYLEHPNDNKKQYIVTTSGAEVMSGNTGTIFPDREEIEKVVWTRGVSPKA
ncbi:hypothetical protein [Primorskyibacter sp. S87]|uniref:hypothetical protein n=1 Tax=Primorskyibacter sp. S87 TaxID=3415126 RepID=UPI003C7BF616